MKKKSLFMIALLLCCGGFLYAQPKATGEPKAIAKMNEPLRTPVWSPDGTKLAMTSIKNDGIWVVEANGENLHQITAEQGAGYQMKWSDNATVVTRSSVEKNSNTLFQQMLDDPAGVLSNVAAFEDLKGYFVFNPVLSPDGSKIVFQSNNGKGLYICNADGSQLRNLGQGERASWTPEGKYVVVMVVADDGEVITKGELISINVTTGVRSTLLSSDKYVALSPAVSPDGAKVAFEEYRSGVIYVMDIK